MVGTAVATFCAGASIAARRADAADDDDGRLVRGDMFAAAIGGCVFQSEIPAHTLAHQFCCGCRVLAVTIAAEIAAARSDVKGSGTFLPALIDELGKLTPEVIQGRANVEVVQ